jgi:(S)-sulfolactate dehydrogenase
MPDIVITEFMDVGPVEDMKAKYEVHWDKTLCEKPEEIKALLPGARALVVRNRTRSMTTFSVLALTSRSSGGSA